MLVSLTTVTISPPMDSVCHPSTQETDQEDREFEARLGYKVRLSQKQKIQIFLSFFFFNTESHYVSPGWPQTHRDSPTSDSLLLGLKLYANLTQPCYRFQTSTVKATYVMSIAQYACNMQGYMQCDI